MIERAIDRTEVEAAFQRPDMTYPGKNGTECRVKEIAGRKIKIVVFQGTDRIKTVIDQT